MNCPMNCSSSGKWTLIGLMGIKKRLSMGTAAVSVIGGFYCDSVTPTNINGHTVRPLLSRKHKSHSIIRDTFHFNQKVKISVFFFDK